MKYVVETLIEAPEDEIQVNLTEEDKGYLFLLLKTVVDMLDERMRSGSKEKWEDNPTLDFYSNQENLAQG